MLLTAIINMKFKISAHAVGIGGLIGSLMMVSYVLKYNAVPEIAILFLLAGVIATCRLYLEAHKPSQIYWGFALGFISQIAVFTFFLNFKLS